MLMRNYEIPQFLHPNNKLGNYIKIHKKDKFLKEFIDYIGFYGRWQKTEWRYLFMSDNGRSAYIDRIQVRLEPSKSGGFVAFGLYAYMGMTVDLFRIMQRNLKGQDVLKIDFYGKGLLVVNRDNLRSSVEKVFTKLFWMEEITITRADYTCDCEKYNFRKVNTLKFKISGTIQKDNQLEYMLFGRRWKSARVLRYYDKMKELIARGTTWLYPEYFGLSGVMRYELQVNSEWFDKAERDITINQLKEFANFGVYIPDNAITHKKKKEATDYEIVDKVIRKIYRDKNQEAVSKIKCLLEMLDSSTRLAENI